MTRKTDRGLRRLSGRFPPGVWAITLAGFFNSAGFSISLPFIALYMYGVRGLSMTEVGLILLASGLFAAAAQLLSGLLTDRLGRRPLLLATTLCGLLLQFTMALLVGAHAPMWQIVLAYTGVRAALMMGMPAVQAVVADLAPKERLVEAYGVLRVGQNLGWAAGPAFGGYLAATLSYGWLFATAGAMGALTLLLIFFLVKESRQGGRPSDVSIRSMFAPAANRSFLWFIGLSALIFLVMGQMASTLSVFTVGHVGFSTQQYGLLLAMNGMIVVLLQYPATLAAGRVPHGVALVVGSLLYGIGYLTMSWVGSFAIAAAGMAIVTLGEVTLAPTTLAVVGELSPPDRRGRYMGLYGLSGTIGMALGPMAGGVLLDKFASHPLFIWGSVCLLAFLAAAGFGVWSRRANRPHHAIRQ